MTRTEAARRLREIAYEIYDKLDEMEDILEEIAPEELERARVSWMARIDGALLNLLRKSKDGWPLTTLEEEITEEERPEGVEEEVENEGG